MKEVEKLLELEKIQKSLNFLQSQLENPNYSAEDFAFDLVEYLKEIQYNGKIPKDIDIEESVYFFCDDKSHELKVDFSESLEEFLTSGGNFIIDELKPQKQGV